MSPQLRALIIVTSLCLLMITLELVRRGKLREEYSLLFLVWSGVTLLLAVFAGTLARLARSFGIGYGPSLGFGLAFLLALIILMVQGVIISSLSVQIRDLAQKVAELEWQLRQLRRRTQKREEEPELVWPEASQQEWDAIQDKTAVRM